MLVPLHVRLARPMIDRRRVRMEQTKRCYELNSWNAIADALRCLSINNDSISFRFYLIDITETHQAAGKKCNDHGHTMAMSFNHLIYSTITIHLYSAVFFSVHFFPFIPFYFPERVFTMKDIVKLSRACRHQPFTFVRKFLRIIMHSINMNLMAIHNFTVEISFFYVPQTHTISKTRQLRVSRRRRRHYFTIHFLQSHLPYSWINKQLKPLAMRVKSHKAISEKLQPACSHCIARWTICSQNSRSVNIYAHAAPLQRRIPRAWKISSCCQKLTNHIQNVATRALAGRLATGARTARSQSIHWRHLTMWCVAANIFHSHSHLCNLYRLWTNRMCTIVIRLSDKTMQSISWCSDRRDKLFGACP